MKQSSETEWLKLKKEKESLDIKINFIETLAGFRLSEGTTQQNIFKKLIVFVKYNLLNASRAHKHGVSGTTLSDLELLKEKDEQIKIIVYKKEIKEIEGYFIQFPLDFMIEFLIRKDSPKELEWLEGIRQKERGKIRVWEVNLDREIAQLNARWLPYLWHKSKKAANFVYSNSLVYIGTKLLPWLTQPVVNLVERTRLKPRTKTAIQTSAKWTFTIMGGALGSYFTGLGIYPVIRMVGTSALALKLYNYLNQPYIRDQEALVEDASRYKISQVTSSRAIILSLLICEAGHFRQSQILVEGLGGMAGSIGLAQLMQRLLSQLALQEDASLNEDRAMLLYCGHILGNEVGRGLTSYGVSFFQEIFFRRDFHQEWVQLLRNLEREGTIGHLRFNDITELNDIMEIEWQSQNLLFYQMRCQVDKDRPIVTCENPELVLPLRLNSSVR